nr:uncharacterized protein LOC108945274 [Nicotiana tomentosiformis]
MYDARLSFNCVNYTDGFGEFIEVVGQYGPGMKPPTYHEVRIPCLKKEAEKTNEIVEEHKVQWQTNGCSIMMDKWTTKNEKMVINVLVNYPRGSVFLESYDASDSSTNSDKMFNLFEKTLLKIGKENVVQVVTDNASENKKAGEMGRENHQWDTFMKPWIGPKKLLRKHLINIRGNMGKFLKSLMQGGRINFINLCSIF